MGEGKGVRKEHRGPEAAAYRGTNLFHVPLAAAECLQEGEEERQAFQKLQDEHGGDWFLYMPLALPPYLFRCTY